MNNRTVLRLLFAGFFSFLLARRVFTRDEIERGIETVKEKDHRYWTYSPVMWLPYAVILIAILSPIFYGAKATARELLSICFDRFAHISVFYLFMVLLLPFLRKHISARACATLWLIPNALYVVGLVDALAPPKPLVVFHAPDGLLWILVGIWLAGAAVILLWNTISHLIFRYWILTDATPVTDEGILELWKAEQLRANLKKPYRLVISPDVKTPLSIGFFRRTIRVVLPERRYTGEELTLIFRHELIHISRRDSENKFFLLFCAAICWFNPLMWLAMRKCADDLELSCDETVLLDADEPTRRLYADLILTTAGDQRGFTTCLSASAKALRYRLKNIVKPHDSESIGWGAVAVGLAFFVLCMSAGFVTLAYEEAPGSEIIFQSEDPAACSIWCVGTDSTRTPSDQCADEDGLNEYLAGLSLSKMTGSYTLSEPKNYFYIMYNYSGDLRSVAISDNALRVIRWDGKYQQQSDYYVNSEIDWDYLNSLVIK